MDTSAVVFVGFHVSRRPATSRYPYGDERAEDLAGLGVALVIWASALFAGVESYRKLIAHGHTSNVYIGMLGAAVGVVGNQVVARYKLRVGRRISSATLVADARHSWLDALSSAGALVGLALVAAGYRGGDPVAGFAVTLFIIHVGWEVSGDLLHHLMDGVDEEHVTAAVSAARGVPGVLDAAVRGRWTGRSLILDVSGKVDPHVTLADSDGGGSAVRSAVHDAVAEARVVNWTPHAGWRGAGSGPVDRRRPSFPAPAPRDGVDGDATHAGRDVRPRPDGPVACEPSARFAP